MGRNAIETVLGAVVLVIAGLFMTFAYSSADLQKVQGYTVSAHFPMIDGLKDGTDVKVNGVKVGSISGLSLITAPGTEQYKVDVKMTILPDVLLPTDTIAMIASESLLGGKYMSLEIGVDEENIKTDGSGRITHTQSPMRLDDLIGQLIYSSKKSDSSASSSQAAPAPAAAPAPVVTPTPAPESNAYVAPKAEAPAKPAPKIIPPKAPLAAPKAMPPAPPPKARTQTRNLEFPPPTPAPAPVQAPVQAQPPAHFLEPPVAAPPAPDSPVQVAPPPAPESKDVPPAPPRDEAPPAASHEEAPPQ